MAALAWYQRKPIYETREQNSCLCTEVTSFIHKQDHKIKVDKTHPTFSKMQFKRRVNLYGSRIKILYLVMPIYKKETANPNAMQEPSRQHIWLKSDQVKNSIFKMDSS